MIELSDIYLCDDMFAYHNVKYGKNVGFQSQKGNVNNSHHCRIKAVELKQMKMNYIMVVVEKSDVLNKCNLSNILILQHGSQCVWNDEADNKYKPSGKLVLMVATLNINKSGKDMCWSNVQFNTIKDAKNSKNISYSS